MDEIDKKLIKILTHNARTPLKHLAQEVFLSSPAVSGRIDRLEATEIITGYKAEINYSKLGYNITAFINLVMAPEYKPSFTNYISTISNVVECYNVAGAYSMLLKVYFTTTAELDTFVVALQKFGKTQTQIVFSTVIQPRGINL
ncbi:MAG: Lrp/AsnC family transcriptional regulator [Clostridiaceae bacterium]